MRIASVVLAVAIAPSLDAHGQSGGNQHKGTSHAIPERNTQSTPCARQASRPDRCASHSARAIERESRPDSPRTPCRTGEERGGSVLELHIAILVAIARR